MELKCFAGLARCDSELHWFPRELSLAERIGMHSILCHLAIAVSMCVCLRARPRGQRVPCTSVRRCVHERNVYMQQQQQQQVLRTRAHCSQFAHIWIWIRIKCTRYPWWKCDRVLKNWNYCQPFLFDPDIQFNIFSAYPVRTYTHTRYTTINHRNYPTNHTCSA